MSSIHDRLTTLLVELDEVCKENNIPYFLSGLSALGAHTNGKHLPPISTGDILIFIEDCPRLIKAIEAKKLPNRELDGLHNNPRTPDFRLRYSDEESTSLNLVQTADYLSHGINITISFIRNLPKEKKVFYRTLERNMHVLSIIGTKEKFKRRLGAFLFNIYSMFRSQKRCEKIFYKLIDIYSQKSKKKYMFVGLGIEHFFSEDFFSEMVPVELDGHTFNGLKDYDTYLTEFYSPEWKTKPNIIRSSQYPLRIASTEIDYKSFINDILGHDYKMHYKYVTRASVTRKQKNALDANKYINTVWKILNHVESVENIKSAFNKQTDNIDAEHLNHIMTDYEMTRFLVRNLDLKFEDGDNAEKIYNNYKSEGKINEAK